MRLRIRLIALSLFLAACPSMASVGARGGISAEQVAALPPNEAASYELFTKKCSRCHSLARPLTAQIDEPGHWRHYVARMRRQPGSGISPADAEQILVFLEYWTKMRLDEGVVVTTSTVGGEP